MPTVLRMGGFAFNFYADDHAPAHVHARNGDGVVVIDIATATARGTKGNIRDRDIRRAKVLVAEHRDLLQAAWDDFEGRRSTND
jgi:hypothetical protein